MDWKQLLAHITGSVDQELLLRTEYLVTENRILRSQMMGNSARLFSTPSTQLGSSGCRYRPGHLT
jgi:hypothetical protein